MISLISVCALVLVGCSTQEPEQASQTEEPAAQTTAEETAAPASMPTRSNGVDCRLQAAVNDLGTERVQEMLGQWALEQMQVLNPDAPMSDAQREQRINTPPSDEEFYKFLETQGYHC